MDLRKILAADSLQSAMLDILPNPVLVKDANLQYVLVNSAFEELFSVNRNDLYGELDKDIFRERQVAQCNGGDLRVLASGEIDEAYETVFSVGAGPRETITRKSRLTLADGRVFLVGIMHDITEITETNRKLQESQKLLQMQAAQMEQMAHRDPLTGCANRRALYSQAPDLLAGHRNVGSLIMMDIDHFKRVNDTFGHGAGDAMLVHFANTIRQTVRQCDEVIRLGGEEFAVVLPGVGVDESYAMAERLRRAVESRPLNHEGQSISVTVSIGVVHTSDDKVSLDNLLIQGDRCLYEAKNNGRNQVVLASCN